MPAMLCAVIVSKLRIFRIPHPLPPYGRVAKLRLRSVPTKKGAQRAPFLVFGYLLNVTAHHPTLLEITLVIVLSLPEATGVTNLGCDGVPVGSRSVQFGDPRTGFGVLLI